jgi:hypothetical protein
MLVDFLKGNHFEVDTTTMPWLWEARGSACFGIEGSLRRMTGNVHHLYIYSPQWLGPAFQSAGRKCSGPGWQQLGQRGPGPGMERSRSSSQGSRARFSRHPGTDRPGLGWR